MTGKSKLTDVGIEMPHMVRILKVEDEAKDIRTFYLDAKIGSRPGQFVMLWIPRVEEKPFSVGFEDDKGLRLTIAKVGHYTEVLFSMKEGDRIGVRGPYGKPFDTSIEGKEVALVGGGYGTAPLSFLAYDLAKRGNRIHFFTGARTEALLIYRKKLEGTDYDVHTCTDDGTCGYKGFVTDALDSYMQKSRIDMIYTVGPELMMKRVVEISDKHDVPCQISLERHMKCGFGVCGVCAVDPLGIRMCVEGPCIDKETAKKITEFGEYHRDAAGKKVYFRKK